MASTRYARLALTLAAALLAVPLTAPLRSDAATFTVNRTFDAVDARPGDGVCETARGNRICTLRAAIQEANARPGADTINLPAGTYTLTLQNQAHEDLGINGDLDITDSVRLVGAGAATTIITASGPATFEIERIFDLHGPITVTIRGVTILNGGRRFAVGAGAGIANDSGTLSVERSVITGCSAEGLGGGISNAGGLVTISNSRIEGNGAEVSGGGGIANLAGGTVIVTDSTIRRNVTQDGSGAGILNVEGTVMIVNGSVTDNRAGAGPGGAIHNGNGLIIVTNTTFKGNVSGFQTGGDTSGGNIVNSGGTITLNNVTIADNGTASSPDSTGGGLLNHRGRITLHNSVLARNHATTGPDCSGIITSLGYNIVGDLSGCTFVRGPRDNVGDPHLGAFVRSSFPGAGHFPLQPGSPAIDSGLSATCGANDQLGQPRRDGDASSGTQCDRGAVELQP